jgi:hypothetical protein
LQLSHAPLVVAAPLSTAELVFSALCSPQMRNLPAMPAPGGDPCAGADFELTISRAGAPSVTVATTYVPGDATFHAQLSVGAEGEFSYRARISWKGLTASDGGDVLVESTSPLTGVPAALARRTQIDSRTTVPWSRSTVRPLFAGGVAVGPGGWARTSTGDHWLIDPGDDDLVELTADGSPRARQHLPVPGATVTGLAVAPADAGVTEERALIASQRGPHGQVLLLDLNSQSVLSSVALEEGVEAGYLVHGGDGTVELATYPGPRYHAVHVSGNSLRIDPGQTARSLDGGTGQQMRIKVAATGATYCMTMPQTACYALTPESLGGWSTGEVAYAGGTADGGAVVVQKVFNDQADFYLVLRLRGNHMAAVGSLSANNQFDIPVGARFSYDRSTGQLSNLAADDSGLILTSTHVGG